MQGNSTKTPLIMTFVLRVEPVVELHSSELIPKAKCGKESKIGKFQSTKRNQLKTKSCCFPRQPYYFAPISHVIKTCLAVLGRETRKERNGRCTG